MGSDVNDTVDINLGNSEECMLFNLKEALSHQTNLAVGNQDKLSELLTEFEVSGAEVFHEIGKKSLPLSHMPCGS